MEEEEEGLGEGKRTRSRENGGLVRNLRKNEKREKWKKRERWKKRESGREMERAARQNELRAGCV